MENPIKMDDLGGFPPIFGNTHVIINLNFKSFHGNQEPTLNQPWKASEKNLW